MTEPTDHAGPPAKAQVTHPRKSLGRIGALKALDRLCEENHEGLRRLAQQDD